MTRPCGTLRGAEVDERAGPVAGSYSNQEQAGRSRDPLS
jgi:hypothetical protein